MGRLYEGKTVLQLKRMLLGAKVKFEERPHPSTMKKIAAIEKELQYRAKMVYRNAKMEIAYILN